MDEKTPRLTTTGEEKVGTTWAGLYGLARAVYWGAVGIFVLDKDAVLPTQFVIDKLCFL
jgi:hypothetical protein